MLADTLPLVLELLELLVLGALTTGLSVAGVYVERFAIGALRGGNVEVGAWATLAGLVMLGFAYLLATDKLVERIATLRRELERTEG